MQGVWWRPRDSDVSKDVLELLSMGVTDVCVWAESFVNRLSTWTELLRKVQMAGIRFHTWITVNHHYAESFIQRLRVNPDWAAVDYDGVPNTKKPFAGVQTWPCPVNEDRWRVEWEIWKPLIQGVDGLHLDYIRYPDGFRFGEKPELGRVEVAEQSFCYCSSCRSRYQEEMGIDPRIIPVQEGNPLFAAWKKWRQDRIGQQVHWYRSRLIEDFSAQTQLSAAVFPTPVIARNNVQQDWARFSVDLDFVCPMIYAKQFWGQPVSWTKEAVEEGRREMVGRSKLLAGIGPYQSYDLGELGEAILAGRSGGSDGEMLFVYPMEAAYVHAARNIWRS